MLTGNTLREELKKLGKPTGLKLFHRPEVKNSPDLQRILALPRRKEPSLGNWSSLRKPDASCRCAELGRPCAKELFPIQAQALTEASQVGGILGAIGVGHGKTLICMLLPFVMQSKMAILLIPPEGRESFKLDWVYYGQHWLQPNLVGGEGPFTPGFPRLKVLAYSELSSPDTPMMLKTWAPDLIIADEAHALARMISRRTDRLIGYCAEAQHCRFVPLSGTLTRRSLRDYAHLSALSLGAGSPLPIAAEVLEEWALAIDPQVPWGKVPALPGALKALCLKDEPVRIGFRARLLETPGVVATSEASIPNSLNIHLRKCQEMPRAVKAAMLAVATTKNRPDGEEFVREQDVAQCLKELASGYYYRWIFPRGESADLIQEWRSARSAWNREVRGLLERPKPYLDSPGLALRAALRAELGKEGTEEKPVWRSLTFSRWRKVHKSVYHETEAVWVDDWLARDAALWAKDHTGICWYAHRAFGLKVAEISGLKRFGGGDRASAEIIRLDGKTSIIASMPAHHRIKNLQMFSQNLVAQPPPDAGMWEQLLGRTHRRHQQADTVECWMYLHCEAFKRSFREALRISRYNEETTPNRQKLCLATYSFDRHLTLGGEEA